MSYPIIDKTSAEILLKAHREGGIYDAPRYAKIKGIGENDIDGIDFSKLHIELKKIFVGPRPKGVAQDAYFEMMGCSLVHKTLSDISTLTATDPGFWMWVTFASCGNKLVEFVDARMKKGEQLPAEDNFGITTRANVFEGLYARLWWRGFRFLDDKAPNPYDLAERGDVDFWRSHIIRQKYSYSDSMSKAFIRFIFPEHKQTSSNNILLMRKIASKLKARHASCAYESLTEDKCTEILVAIAEEAGDELNQTPKSSKTKSLKAKKK
jgi:hypothetical protein